MIKPHGHIKVNWVGNILEVHPFGPFNEEGTAVSVEEMQALAHTRINDLPSWQRLDILSYETLGGPEVMKMIGRSYLWCFNNGCNAIATVYSTQIQKAILLDFMDETKTNMAPFVDKQSALAWLREQDQLHLSKSANR